MNKCANEMLEHSLDGGVSEEIVKEKKNGEKRLESHRQQTWRVLDSLGSRGKWLGRHKEDLQNLQLEHWHGRLTRKRKVLLSPRVLEGYYSAS
ncbi:hypothetical protein NPIL_392521 [Nephila pilipes]|uniref:Uncharacterized protein n=1 Tax=Nephila pilipes TaxID=299642 RepID=A0A8X6N8X6_NEPPI|nr:hypothetical protein NPIL_392521 [Nephila pilipes]